MNNLSKVQKKNKAQKPAPFVMFANEMKCRLKQQGINIHNFRQLLQMASPEWEKLSTEEKDTYKEKSKTSEKIPHQARTLFTSNGKSFEEMEAERQRGLRMYEAMIEEIESLVTQADELGDLDTTTFYFISTSMFYDCNENIFPAELAMAKFNLKDGVYQDIQIRINPGELPLGARHDAQEISNKIHQYPLPPNCDGEKDYMTMLETMIRFIHPLDKLPVFFTEGYDTKKDSMSKTRKIVERIFYESAEDDMMADVKIYPIEYLFQILQRATITNINRLNDTNEKPFSSISFAANKFYNNQYEYSAHGCQFHYDKDCTQHCCLSKVRRYGYMMAEYCANKDRFPLQEGQHYPRGYNPK